MRANNGIAILVVCLLAACSDDPVEPPTTDTCNAVTLPLAGPANAPVITNVGLEVQESGIVVVATATDPQGTDNLRDVVQRVGVYPDRECSGAPIVLEDDLVGSGVEETFGTAVDASTSAALYDAIAAAATWPVTVDFRDADGNRTTGTVNATVLN